MKLSKSFTKYLSRRESHKGVIFSFFFFFFNYFSFLRVVHWCSLSFIRSVEVLVSQRFYLRTYNWMVILRGQCPLRRCLLMTAGAQPSLTVTRSCPFLTIRQVISLLSLKFIWQRSRKGFKSLPPKIWLNLAYSDNI